MATLSTFNFGDPWHNNRSTAAGLNSCYMNACAKEGAGCWLIGVSGGRSAATCVGRVLNPCVGCVLW